MRRVYAFPCFGSEDRFGIGWFGAPGLGNCLFPFARSAVLSRRYGLARINPTWTQPKIGPWLRGERDNRLYFGLFNNGFGLSGLGKMAVLAAAERIPESHDAIQAALRGRSPRPAVVLVRGFEDWFKPILRDHAAVLEELLGITRKEHVDRIAGFREDCIGIHVRRGDFAPASAESAAQPLCANQRTPISWFVETLRKVRACLGRDLGACVFSDGTSEELEELLRLPKVRRVFFGSAVSDLLALSRCRVMMASGGSTFSMWAAYFGRMPTIWYPSWWAQMIFYEGGTFEGPLPAEAPIPDLLRENLRQRFAGLAPR